MRHELVTRVPFFVLESMQKRAHFESAFRDACRTSSDYCPKSWNSQRPTVHANAKTISCYTAFLAVT